MQAILNGNFLDCKAGKSKDGFPYYSVAILSGNDTCRISFDDEPDSIELFSRFTKMKRLEPVSCPVEFTVYNGNIYFKAITDTTK